MSKLLTVAEILRKDAQTFACHSMDSLESLCISCDKCAAIVFNFYCRYKWTMQMHFRDKNAFYQKKSKGNLQIVSN